MNRRELREWSILDHRTRTWQRGLLDPLRQPLPPRTCARSGY
jgi:hypothetical protein